MFAAVELFLHLDPPVDPIFSLSFFFFFFFLKKGNGNRFGLCSESLKEIDKLSQIIVDKIHRKNQQIIRRYFQCSRISTRSVFAIRMKTVSALTNRHRASKYQHNLILGADPLNQTKHSSKSNIDSYSFQECITIIRVVPRLVEENWNESCSDIEYIGALPESIFAEDGIEVRSVTVSLRIWQQKRLSWSKLKKTKKNKKKNKKQTNSSMIRMRKSK